MTGGRTFVSVVHRLDKDGSGLVAFATSKRGPAALQKRLEDHSMGRTYDALYADQLFEEGPRETTKAFDLPDATRVEARFKFLRLA